MPRRAEAGMLGLNFSIRNKDMILLATGPGRSGGADIRFLSTTTRQSAENQFQDK